MPDGTPESTANETPASVRVFRFDRQGEPDFQFETREDGSILTVARAAVCGVMRYVIDGVERLELVDEETLNDPRYLTGFRYRATTLEHPDKMVTPENIRNYRRGTTTERSEYRDEAHYLGVVLDDAEMLAAVQDGKHEVSPGYECDLLETPGVHAKYGRYDAIQRNRKPNHFAICDKARGGSTVRLLRTDSAEGTPVSALIGERVHVDAEPPAPSPLPNDPPV